MAAVPAAAVVPAGAAAPNGLVALNEAQIIPPYRADRPPVPQLPATSKIHISTRSIGDTQADFIWQMPVVKQEADRIRALAAVVANTKVAVKLELSVYPGIFYVETGPGWQGAVNNYAASGSLLLAPGIQLRTSGPEHAAGHLLRERGRG
eukprot:gene36824-33837_t